LATFKEDPAAYMRDRRARLKAEAERAVALGDTSEPKGPEAQRARQWAEAAAIRAKVAAIGRGAVITRTPDPVGGKLKLDVVTTAAWKARQKTPGSSPGAALTFATARPTVSPTAARPAASGHAKSASARPLPSPVPAAASKGVSSNGHANRELMAYRPPLRGEIMPPPRSMIADGGTPPRSYARDASIAETTAFIRAYAAQQASINAEMTGRLAALEKAKAETDRRLEAIERRKTGIVAVVQGVASLFSLV
jgi:hypothetical protein